MKARLRGGRPAFSHGNRRLAMLRSSGWQAGVRYAPRNRASGLRSLGRYRLSYQAGNLTSGAVNGLFRGRERRRLVRPAFWCSGAITFFGRSSVCLFSHRRPPSTPAAAKSMNRAPSLGRRRAGMRSNASSRFAKSAPDGRNALHPRGWPLRRTLGCRGRLGLGLGLGVPGGLCVSALLFSGVRSWSSVWPRWPGLR